VPLLTVRNLKTYFRVRAGWVKAVDGVNLSLEEGETIGLVGESGCGKTTLAYSITQLLPSNAHVFGGQIIFDEDSHAAPYRPGYWKMAEARAAADLQRARADLEALQSSPVTKETEPRLEALSRQVDVLQNPLSETYRRYLAPEIQTLEQSVRALTVKFEGGDKTSRRALAEAKNRLAAATQRGDLIDITRRPDGRLREYHPKLNAVRWKRISIVFQGAMNALNPVYTVGRQIIETIRTHEDVGPEAAKARVEELYRLVGIPADRIDNYPHEYSGGMKQRAMIAMALALGPRLVIADEPTTALDVITASKIMDEILRLQKDLRMALIIISHDVSVVAKVADRIAVMYAGKIVEEGPSAKIFSRTIHPYTEGLLSAFPSVVGERRRLVSIPGNPPSLLSPPNACRFHPRCQYAKDICSTVDPPEVIPEEGHRGLCHFVDEFYSRGGLFRG
jgi:peptide/nickel transport system ATP-binding protein